MVGHSRHLFSFICVISFNCRVNRAESIMASIKIVDDWIRSAYLCCQKRPLCQLCYRYWQASLVLCHTYLLLSIHILIFPFSPSPILLSLSSSLFSVIRFGEISPLWQHKKVFGPCYEGLSSIWQNYEPTKEKIILLGLFLLL